MNKVLNATKRLERVGSEDSIWSNKLRGAVGVVVKEKIFNVILAGMPEVPDEDDASAPNINYGDWLEMTLPRGYHYSVNTMCDREFRAPKKDDSEAHGGLLFSELLKDKTLYDKYGDALLWGRPATQKEILQFSVDVATGLLDEIAEMLQKKKAEEKLKQEKEEIEWKKLRKKLKLG